MPFLIALISFGLYLWITPPVSGLGDGPEFTLGLSTCGLVHPTGYPVYILAGHLFVRILHGLGMAWPLAANAWSGAGAAAAVALCYAAARRLILDSGEGVRPERELGPRFGLLVALVPAAVLAFNPVVLGEAAEAEVYSWSLAWALGLVLLFANALRRVGHDQRSGRPAFSAACGAGWGVVCGLGLAHHLTSVLVSAPLTLGLGIALARRRSLGLRVVLSALAGAVVPLLAYGFVLWRAAHPAPGQWADIAPTFRSVLAHVTGERYRYFLGSFAPDEMNRRLLATGVYPILVPGMLLLAIAVLGAKERLLYGSLLAASLLTLLFTLNYGVPDPAPYLLPAAGLSLLGLCPWLARAALRPAWKLAVLTGAAFVVWGLAWSGLADARVRRQEAIRFDRDVRSLWALVPDRPALLFWHADQVTRLLEYQILNGERRAVWVASPDWLLDAPVRAEMRRRFGVDPLEGMTVPYTPFGAPWGESVRARFFRSVLSRIAARTALPVYEFDPMAPRLTLVPKQSDAAGP
ncbi:MAG: protein O-mannosyl-transferase family [Bacteroidota bacterium]